VSTETELKLCYSAEDLDRLRRSSILRRVARGAVRTQRLVSVYYDTPEHALANENITIRVRRKGRHRVLGVKVPESTLAGLAVRREWEVDIAGDAPDFSRFPPGTIEMVLDVAALQDRLVPVFTTDFERAEREAGLVAGSVVRLAVDQGTVTAGGRTEPLAEVELELAEGDTVALFDLALALHRAVPARIGTRAKSARGFDLALGRTPAPRLAADVALDPDGTVGDAFARIVAACIDHWLGNQDAVLAAVDPEGVHQMRVALRRLRSAVRAFRPLVADPHGAALADEVRWLAGALGPARDWDVFVEDILGPVAETVGAEAQLGPLAEAAEAARRAGHAAAIAAVGDTRYTDLVLGLGRWLAGHEWNSVPGAASAGAAPVAGFAAARLTRHWRRVRKAGRNLTRLEAPELHALRIEIKKLRYCVEFFASLYDAKAVRRFLAGLKGLQDFLGHLNDLDVARRLMASIDDGRPDMARAEGTVIGWHAAGLARDRRHLADLWARVLAQEPFWD
jgi:inorganic triphosphatase YgiF